MRWTRLARLFWTLALFLQLALLGGMSLLWNLIALLLYPLLPAERGQRIGRLAIHHCYRLFWRLAALSGMLQIDSTVLDSLRDEPGLIIAANHPSLLDALIVVARLPRGFCIMKAELLRNVFLAGGARLARYISNSSPRHMIRQAVADLRQGGQLVVFPEGTRTTRWPVNAFRPGVTLIAKLARAPIQTVFIHTDSPYLRKGWPLWRLPPLPIVFSLRLGERFQPSTDTTALLQELEHYFASSLQHERTAGDPP